MFAIPGSIPVKITPAAERQIARLMTGKSAFGLRIGLKTRKVDVLIDAEELAERRRVFDAAGGYRYPASQTPWQEIQRSMVGELETGAVLEPAVKYHRIVDTLDLPRDNH